MNIDKKILKNNLLFKDINDNEFDEVISALDGNIQTFPAGTYIKHAGDALKDICIVLSVEIYAQRIDENGINCILSIFYPGSSFGESNAISKYPLNVDIIAKNDSKILFLAAGKFFHNSDKRFSAVTVKALKNLSLVLARKHQHLLDKIEDRVHRSTRQRLQDYLSEQYHINQMREFTIPLDRQDLADYLFVDRSAMSKELGKMKEEGLIQFDKADFKLMVSMPITDKKDEPEYK